MDDISRILDGGAAPAAPENAPSDDDGLLVSKRVVSGAPVLFVYRDEPDEGDSGWTLLAGTEADAVLGDPSKFEEKTVGWALEVDETLASILAAPKDSSFERDDKDAAWVELVDE